MGSVVKNKIIVVGSLVNNFSGSISKKCFDCGRTCWFNDNWDWSTVKPVCTECYFKKYHKEPLFVHTEAIKKYANLFDLEEWEANITIREAIKKSTDKDVKVVGDDVVNPYANKKKK